MAPSRLSLKRTLLVTSFVALSLFATTSMAQNGDESTEVADPTSENNDNETTIPADDDEPPTSVQVSVSQTTTASRTTQTTALPIPSLPGSTQSAVAGPSDLPTLTGLYNTYSYPPPTVPPTRKAPFMQTSSLPDGTVFIAVGAILGAFGAAVLIWRGIVACLLHRSVEKATVAQHAANDKAFPAPPAQFYKYRDQESKVSIAANRRTDRGPVPSATPSQTNLFFSPTAAPGGHQARDSRASFLPNGFYPATAAGSPSPQNGVAHQHSISLTNLRPTSRGQVASYAGPSPPDSPSFGPNRSTPALRNVSTSSLNRPSSQRAPSAYLEDLLDDNPQMFPPQGGVPPMPPQPPPHGQSRF